MQERMANSDSSAVRRGSETAPEEKNKVVVRVPATSANLGEYGLLTSSTLTPPPYSIILHHPLTPRYLFAFALHSFIIL
jgi:hypothetical protein